MIYQTGVDNPNLKYPQQKHFCRNVRLFNINKGIMKLPNNCNVADLVQFNGSDCILSLFKDYNKNYERR